MIADCGNVTRGTPTLTTTLSGYAAFEVEVQTLDSPVRSGMYGGPTPDAFMALVRLLATLHDDKGDVAVANLIRDDDYPFAPMDEKQFRDNAGVRPGVPLIGTGSLAQRLCGRPSINVVGLNGMKSIKDSSNMLCQRATAKISVRLSPSQAPEQACKAIEEHLKNAQPWGIKAKVTYLGTEKETVLAGVGGSTPLVNALSKINDGKAAIVMWGCEEPRCRIHGTNESVSRDELTRMTTAEAFLPQNINKGD